MTSFRCLDLSYTAYSPLMFCFRVRCFQALQTIFKEDLLRLGALVPRSADTDQPLCSLQQLPYASPSSLYAANYAGVQGSTSGIAQGQAFSLGLESLLCVADCTSSAGCDSLGNVEPEDSRTAADDLDGDA